MSLIKQIIDGDRRALAQALTIIENDDHSSQNILTNVYRHTGCAHLLFVGLCPAAAS